VPYYLSPAQKVGRVETSTEMLRILHESEESHFEGIATSDESWFQYSYPSSKVFIQSPTDVVSRTRQAIGTKETMMTFSFTGRKLIMLDILPKGSKFNQLYSVDYIFPSLHRAKVNFIAGLRRRLLSSYGQFNAPQWIKSGIKIREASCFVITAPTLFTRYKLLRLLALWNIEQSLERSRV
jgi:hypothetical protein